MRFNDDVPGERQAQVRDRVGVQLDRPLPIPDAQLVRVPPGQSIEATVQALGQQAEVDYAEPDYAVETAGFPKYYDALFVEASSDGAPPRPDPASRRA